ncbi:MAG: hypothetical protein AAF399_07150 [Bacteroidota bacterium]
MPHFLENDLVKVQIDLPLESYQQPRFDWSGKISRMWYRGVPVIGREHLEEERIELGGQGLCHEFGIEEALGFEEAEIGEWFHKIGVGALKKTDDAYRFYDAFEVQAADFSVETADDSFRSVAIGPPIRGYAYRLEKEISLTENGLLIDYRLENTGERLIQTQEYNHNFVAIADALMGPDYRLKFGFPIRQAEIGEIVNPESALFLGADHVGFRQTPPGQFFFGWVGGKQPVAASWSLEHAPSRLGIREIGNFPAVKVNLWGDRHVISPELFAEVVVQPGESQRWQRKYEVYAM